MKRPLLTIQPESTKLGLPTIMDRALAQKHGVTYVHLAAFAIDVDRVRDLLDQEDNDLPMGWEVFLTEQFLTWRFQQELLETSMLEDVCLQIFEMPPSDENVFGAQLTFAVYSAMHRGKLDQNLKSAFRHWKKAPKELLRDLDRIGQEPNAIQKYAKLCLDAELDPPLAPPTKTALVAMAE